MWTQYDPEQHELKEGTRIRLAGREGRITKVSENYPDHQIVAFDVAEGERVYTKLDQEYYLILARFPDLQIFISEPKISREAAEKIKDFFERHETWADFKAYLDSMVEEEEKV